MSPGDGLHKFFLRSPQERRLFLEAFLLLGIMRAAILLLPFRRITSMMGMEQGEPSALPEGTGSADVSEINWAIGAAAARTPWESACLAQALTGMAMLSRRNTAAMLYLGVAKDATGGDAMNAHAWLRCGERIVTGGSSVERYAALSSFARPAAAGSRKAAT